MSSLVGEESLKDSLAYENTWSVRQLIDLLEEKVDSIRLGGLPGEAGVDLRIVKGGRTLHHQVKRTVAGKGQWTLSMLRDEGVLQDFGRRLDDPNVECVFVSRILAAQLEDIADDARKSETYAEFQNERLNEDRQDWFSKVHGVWGGTEEEVWLKLKRVRAYACDDEIHTNYALSVLRYLVETPAQAANNALREFCLQCVQQEFTSWELWKWLEQHEVRRSPYRNDPRNAEIITRQTETYLNSLRQKLICNPPVVREVMTEALQRLQNATSPADTVILGEAGGGKSAVLYHACTTLISAGWPVLALRLDDLPADLTSEEFQRNLGFTISPARALLLASSGRPALLVIDQLDAVSEYSGRIGRLVERVSEMLNEVRHQRMGSPVHILLACRKVDWNYDSRLRVLHSTKGGKEGDTEGVFEVKGWSDAEIDGVLTKHKVDAGAFTQSQREELLRRPQFLAILVETKPTAQEIKRLSTQRQLFDLYWDKKRRDVDKRYLPYSPGQWFEVLKSLTDKLDQISNQQTASFNFSPADGPLSVPRNHFDRYERYLDCMVTEGVLAVDNGRCRFAHESFYDYCFGRFFHQGGVSLCDYLADGPQSLQQRGQMRQALDWLRDEPAQYRGVLRSIIESDKIRVHLKHLAVVLLCRVTDPEMEDWNLIEPFLNQALMDFDTGKIPSFEISVFGEYSESTGLFLHSARSGWFAGSLQRSQSTALDRLFRILLKYQSSYQADVWKLVAPLRDDPRFAHEMDWLAGFAEVTYSRETFDWLLGHMRTKIAAGEEPNSDGLRFYGLGEKLAEANPEWLAEWIAALVHARADTTTAHGGDLVPDHFVKGESVSELADKLPELFVHWVLPAVLHAAEAGHTQYISSWGSFGLIRSKDDDDLSADDVTFDSLVRALQNLADTNAKSGNHWLDLLANSTLGTSQKIYASLLVDDLPSLTARAAAFLKTGGGVYGSRDKYFELAAPKILNAHAGRFTDQELASIEAGILDYYPASGLRFVERKTEGQLRVLGTFFGYQQVRLLRAMPFAKLTRAGRMRLAQWERKEQSTSPYYPTEPRLRAIPDEVAQRMSPADFDQALRQHAARQGRKALRSCNPSAEAMRKRLKAQCRRFIDYLLQANKNAHPSYVATFLDGIDRSLLMPEDGWVAIQALHRLEADHGSDIMRLFRCLKAAELSDEQLELLLHYIRDYVPPPTKVVWRSPDDTPLKRLEIEALNSVQGQALDRLTEFLNAEPAIVNRVAARLSPLMMAADPPLRSRMPYLCYFMAVHEKHRPFAFDLFEKFASEPLPDEHVLASRWSYEFIRVHLRGHWPRLRPIVMRMWNSPHSELRVSGTKLVCIALVIGHDESEVVDRCLSSTDAEVREAVAFVAGHNINVHDASEWCAASLLKLADDPDDKVARSAGKSLQRKRNFDFSALGAWLPQFVETRGFALASGALLDALQKASATDPGVLIKSLHLVLNRACEPPKSTDDRISFHLKTISEIVKRVYVENRDTGLRSSLLDLVDRLCLLGAIDQKAFD